MNNVVHSGSGALDRLLQRIHRPCNVLLERVRNEDVIFARIAVVRARSGEVVDAVMGMISATRATRTVSTWATGRCSSWNGSRNSLLCKEFGAGYDSRHRSNLSKEATSTIHLHNSP